MHLLRISDIGLLCRLGLMVGEALTDFEILIAMGMITFSLHKALEARWWCLTIRSGFVGGIWESCS